MIDDMDKTRIRLMGASEIADLLSVSRQRASQLASRRDFPEPVAVLRQGGVWLAEDVEAWAVEAGRIPRADDE